VIEFVGALGLNIGPNITWNEIRLDESTDEPITTGLVRGWWLPAYYSGMLDGTRNRDNSPTL
jgi:hypothetical protein